MKSEIITKLEQHIADECKRVDLEQRYNDMLDECFSFECVGGIFAHMSPSRVLKEVDPTAYRCSMNDWEASEGFVEITGDYYERRDVEKAAESFVAELASQISDLESEIEEEESDEDSSAQKVAELKRALAELQAELKEVEKYSY